LAKKLPSIVVGSISRSQQGGDERSLLRGVEIITNMVQDNLRLAEAVEKSSRLDNGQPTENFGGTVVLEVEFDS
jgi:hypothetical protein